MRCPICERENRQGAAFCAGCGALLQQTPDSSAAASPPGLAATSDTDSSESAEAAPAVDRPEQTAEKVGPAADTALQVGDVVGERFELVELVESTAERNVFRARDLRRCPSCGYDDNAPEDRFCLECGAALDKPAWATVVELLRNPPPEYDLVLCEGQREVYVTFEEEHPATEATCAKPTSFRLRWGWASDAGTQREQNEDYVECWAFNNNQGLPLGLFVVADGLGGQDAGEVASRLAVQTVWQTLRERVWESYLRGQQVSQEATEKALREAIEKANMEVRQARSQAHSDMSTTLTLALLIGNVAHLANVGDSRAYLFGADGLIRLTTDHSLVQRLVDAGELAPEGVYSHPQRNLIYETIGDQPEVEADLYYRELAVGDRLLLCTDGLWEAVRAEGISEILLSESDPQRACELLVHYANLAGGEDNASVIIVEVAEG